MSDDLQKKVDRAIRLLQAVAKGYDGEIEVGYSGGKDSDVILHLARRAGIKIRPIYHNTTIDPKRRLGCMCCPLAYYKKRIRQFKKYPGMVRAYCRAAQHYRETHPDVETVGKYTDVYQWFFREVFFERQEKWEQWLAENDASLFGIRDYRQHLMDYFHIDLPDVNSC